MRRNIVIGYFVASIVAMAVSDWALHPSTASAFSFLLWVALGPIGIIGFATIDVSDAMWAIENGLYYLVATGALGACLWFIREQGGVRRRIGKIAMVLIWLTCSYYVMWFLSWAA
jgi:hypothetical protein